MHWKVLWINLVLSCALALAFVKLLRLLGLQDQLNVIIPLLPVFYALLFPALEKSLNRPKTASASLDFSARRTPRWTGKLNAILLGIAVSLLVRLACQSGLPHLLLKLRGHPVDVAGRWKLAILAAEMSLLGAAGGAAVGLLARLSAALEGMAAGVVVSAWTGAHEFAPLYEALEGFSARLGQSLGVPQSLSHGVLLGMLLQVCLFAAWSSLAARLKSDYGGQKKASRGF